jgi:hypothetical protein
MSQMILATIDRMSSSYIANEIGCYTDSLNITHSCLLWGQRSCLASSNWPRATLQILEPYFERIQRRLHRCYVMVWLKLLLVTFCAYCQVNSQYTCTFLHNKHNISSLTCVLKQQYNYWYIPSNKSWNTNCISLKVSTLQIIHRSQNHKPGQFWVSTNRFTGTWAIMFQSGSPGFWQLFMKDGSQSVNSNDCRDAGTVGSDRILLQ